MIRRGVGFAPERSRPEASRPELPARDPALESFAA